MTSTYHKTNERIELEYELIQKAQTNSAHFEPLYNHYFETIYRFVYQRVIAKEEASDITSQVFLKALINIKKFEFRKVPFSAWLFRIAINELNDYYKLSKKSRVVNIETEQLSQLFEDNTASLDEERIEKILAAIKYLDGEDLLLIEMRFFETRPFKEMADIMNITENNAKVKLYRVLDKLKQKIR